MIIAFDLFNTLWDVSDVPEQHLRDYASLLQRYRDTGVYEPLDLSEWHDKLRLFPDVSGGLRRLAKSDYDPWTLSNCPLQWQAKVFNRLDSVLWGYEYIQGFDLAMFHIHKPNIGAYYTATGWWGRPN